MSDNKLRPIPGMGPGFYESGPLLPEEVVSNGPRDFGMTCPLLRISQVFNVKYADVLSYADFLLHQRFRGGGKLPIPVMQAIENHADKFNRLRKGLTP